MATSVKRQENKVLWDVNLTRGIQKLDGFYPKEILYLEKWGQLLEKKVSLNWKLSEKCLLKVVHIYLV